MDMDCSATEGGWFELEGAFRAKDGSMNFLSFFSYEEAWMLANIKMLIFAILLQLFPKNHSCFQVKGPALETQLSESL